MSLRVSRILHAGYVFEHAGVQIAFDPVFENPFSRNCYAFPSVEFDVPGIRSLRLAAVFISHYHDDHCSLESLDLLDRSTPIYIFCVRDEILALIRRLGFVSVHSLVLDEPISVGGFEVVPRRALDADVDSIFHIRAGGLNVLNVVDSWIDPSVLRSLLTISWDMILWPFQTMRELEVLAPSRFSRASEGLPVEWLEQLALLRPHFVVPSSCQFIHESWSWYNRSLFPISYAEFGRAMDGLLGAGRVVRLNPGCAVELARGVSTATDSVAASSDLHSPEAICLPAVRLPWIIPVGEQNVDYEFDSSLVVPLVGSIARNFPALCADEFASVLEFCRVGLLERWRALCSVGELSDASGLDGSVNEPNDDCVGYFAAPRIWRLSVYDHLGVAVEFFYSLNGSSAEFLSESGLDPRVECNTAESTKEAPADFKLAWTTEVPAFKLHAALELGESLTSMYMRINDVVFDDDIEKEMAASDILEDPLIRCLFTGEVFASYQLAQLKRLGVGDS